MSGLWQLALLIIWNENNFYRQSFCKYYKSIILYKFKNSVHVVPSNVYSPFVDFF